MTSVYVHFPWCLAKCPYCDFVSYAAPRESIDHAGYADAVIRELEIRAGAGEFGQASIGTVFFGGGTPSLWHAAELGRVLARIHQVFDVSTDAEITVECNPTSLDREHALRLMQVGVNRLSVGVQALDNAELTYLGRLHDEKGALAVLASVAGIEGLRVSGDLIFGLPDQTAETARSHATRLSDLGLSHMSCYELTIEPGTRFGELAKRGRLPRADDARVIESFLAIDELLTARGFGHYEISNYGKPGHEARHNLGYWRGEPYVGVGTAAYGFLRDPTPVTPDTPASGFRYRNEPLPAKYMQHAPLSARGPEAEPLDAGTMLRERIMLGLRMADGLDVTAAEEDLGITFFTKERSRDLAWLTERGRVIHSESDGKVRIRIPKEQWLYANDTAARLF
jgi:oxygen-independent coproporphyrinogen-3 oxidase